MTSPDKTLREMDTFLEAHPDASVWVKFMGSDNYCHFPSGTVTRDTVPRGVLNENFDVVEWDTYRTLSGHPRFLKCIKNNALHNQWDTYGTPHRGKCPADDLATAEPHTRTPLGVRMDAGDAPTVDWADLSEMDFEKALQTITSIEELSGVANRRRVLRHDFKQWSEVQKSLILSRKFILENKNG